MFESTSRRQLSSGYGVLCLTLSSGLAQKASAAEKGALFVGAPRRGLQLDLGHALLSPKRSEGPLMQQQRSLGLRPLDAVR